MNVAAPMIAPKKLSERPPSASRRRPAPAVAAPAVASSTTEPLVTTTTVIPAPSPSTSSSLCPRAPQQQRNSTTTTLSATSSRGTASSSPATPVEKKLVVVVAGERSKESESGGASARSSRRSSSFVERIQEDVRLAATLSHVASEEEEETAMLRAEETFATEEGGPAEDDEDDDDEEENGEGEATAARREQRQHAAEEAENTFNAKVLADEPIRKAPVAETRPLVGHQVLLSVSPFAHRMHTIVFPPADRPWEGDAQANNAGAFVTPVALDPIPCYAGKRKRIGRKGKFANLSYCIPDGSVRFSSVLAIFGTAGMVECDEGDSQWSVKWCKRMDPDDYKALLPFQKVNHFPGTWGIGRKDNLHKHLQQFQQRYGRDVYGFHPEAWLLPTDQRALQRDMELKQHCPNGMRRNVYIVKQVASACGRQMRLLSKGCVPKGKWIVQRYVHDPLLIYGYKFDLRIYVVVTSYNPLRVYVYEEGLVRFATTPYPTPKANGMKVKSITAHLTNYSVNRHNAEAFVNPTDGVDGEDEEKGSKWVLSTVKKYFEKNGLNWAATWDTIEDLIVKTLLSVEPDVNAQMRNYFGARSGGISNCFELYGFDVLLRRNLEPVLMEVNIMPSLSTRCSLLDQRVKANMIADMLTLVGAYSAKKSHKKRTGTTSATTLGHPFLDQLSPFEADVVCQTEEENLRRTHFKRLFPTATAHDTYRRLFPEVRPLNVLLCDWEKAKQSSLPLYLREGPHAQTTSLDPSTVRAGSGEVVPSLSARKSTTVTANDAAEECDDED